MFYIFVSTYCFKAFKLKSMFHYTITEQCFLRGIQESPWSSAVHISRKCNFSLSGEAILMKPNEVTVYDLRMCMKKANPGPNCLKGNNWYYQGYPCMI